MMYLSVADLIMQVFFRPRTENRRFPQCAFGYPQGLAGEEGRKKQATRNVHNRFNLDMFLAKLGTIMR